MPRAWRDRILSSKPVQRVWWESVAVQRCCYGLGDLDQQFAELALQGLLALAVTGVPGQILDGFVLALTEVIGHLGFLRLQFRQQQPKRLR